MFYNNMLKMGMVKTYTFSQQNDGNIIISNYTDIFLPTSYDYRNDVDAVKIIAVKLTLFGAVLLIYSYQIFRNFRRLFQKTQALFRHWQNPFEEMDIAMSIQQILFLSFLIYWAIIFLPQLNGDVVFSLPVRTEQQFDIWVT